MKGYRVLTETAFDWKAGRDYEISVCAQGARLHAEIKEVPVGCRQNQQLQTETAVLEYEDTDHPYRRARLACLFETEAMQNILRYG